MNSRIESLSEQVLGAFLLRPQSIAAARPMPADFVGPYRRIFDAMQAATMAGETVDVFAVCDRLKGSEDKRLTMMLAKESTGANVAQKLAALREERRKVQVGDIAEQAAVRVRSGGASAGEAVGALVTELTDLMRETSARAFDAGEMAALLVDHLEEIHEAKTSGKERGVPTGIGQLDQETGGLHPSDLVIVGARPAVGKTAMACSAALHAAQRGKRVGFISTEMGVEQISGRFVALIGGIEGRKLRDMDLSETEWQRLTVAIAQLKALPLRILDQPVCRPLDIGLQARTWMACGGLDVMYVDYLTRLKPDRKAERRDLEVGEIARSMKSLARELNIPVVCLAQLSRDVEKRSDKRPTMADLRDSGEIEQEADQVWFLYRAHVYDASAPADAAEILIDKNRHGRTCDIAARFVPETMRWCDAMDGWE